MLKKMIINLTFNWNIMHKITLPSKKTFTSNTGQSLLDAARDNGITFPYSCQNGRCSACKCRITGPSTALFDELGLTAEEKESGWNLACARSAIGDITLEIEDLGELNLPLPKILPTKINSLELVSNNVMIVTLRIPPGRNFEFIEGQYINIIGPGGIKRSYSIANHCIEYNNIEIHIKQITGGKMSDYWFNFAKVNDLLRINGPFGTFVLRHNIKTNIIFLATGTGIAPIKAMIEKISTLSNELKPNSVHLFWGARYNHDLYWEPRAIMDRFYYTPVLSKKDINWSGECGYVQDLLIKSIKGLSNTQVYACGSDKMISAAKSSLKIDEYDDGNFFADAFVSSN